MTAVLVWTRTAFKSKMNEKRWHSDEDGINLFTIVGITARDV